VHIGHIQVASGVAAHCRFDEVRLLPCAQHALGKMPGADSAQRSAMLKLALTGLQSEKITLDTRELERSGVSYSITSCQEIREETGADAVLGFIIGTDLLATLHQWHNWRSILSYVSLVVVERAAETAINSSGAKGSNFDEDGFVQIRSVPEVQALLSRAVPALTKPCGELVRVQLPPYPVSSTNIRQQLARLYSEVQACQLQDATLGDLNSLSETGKMSPDVSRCIKQLQSSIDSRVLSYIVENHLYSNCASDS